ncbi:PucR family transcriptional regulator [Anoxybacteroides rupiense]|uniref:PucR family transcriptional regulator n=2 Tax=Bacillales TaxID=1385 RepID=A0ABD5IUL9_9BACL|nr:PucR family transcriptional regulator [Anoxybacillus rupiensis]MBS2772219.1 PucR family transcriptional regulator [Anoxybacillus rupiensis]MED5051641.1 PucR family transcriptional regulator [Anoxybacillus rupiensis]
MHEHFQFTVLDVLNRKHFEHTQVIAGHQGLHRTVKWVHVVEVTKIHKLLNGKELILSTGVGWKENGELFLSFVEQLIESDASGLCIEIGTYTSSIPPEVIQLANEHHFPIILFLKEVPFVEITQDIHAYLINQHYQMISNLEAYSQQLNQKLLFIEHYNEILKYLHRYLGHQILFRMHGKEVEFVPECCEAKKQLWLKQVAQPTKKAASQSIQLFSHEYAELSMISTDRDISEFDLLILDRTATALAQYLLRDLYVEEKKRAREQEWLKGWLEGEHSVQTILDYLADHDVELKPKGGCVCICKFKSLKQHSAFDMTYFKLLFRTMLEQQGFQSFPIEMRGSIVFILVDKRSVKTWKQRMQTGIQRLMDSEFANMKNMPCFFFSVGKFAESLALIHKSYQTALETSKIQQQLSQKTKSCFYEDLHLARIISLIHKDGDLHEMMMEYLEPVIQYDKKYNGKLMETLKVYLACNGSKKETAKRLYVVRQTLYHRIQKLESLLGADFMNPEKRLAIEFMIQAYEYLAAGNE